jgi:hypothetical protein
MRPLSLAVLTALAAFSLACGGAADLQAEFDKEFKKSFRQEFVTSCMAEADPTANRDWFNSVCSCAADELLATKSTMELMDAEALGVAVGPITEGCLKKFPAQ